MSNMKLDLLKLKEGYKTGLWRIQDIADEAKMNQLTVRDYVLNGKANKLNHIEDLSKSLPKLLKKAKDKIEKVINLKPNKS